MANYFNRDPFPGNPKILFIGLAHSSHTHGWIDLLADAKLNVRLYGMPGGLPPANWQVKTYISGLFTGKQTSIRNYLYSGIAGKPRLIYGKLLRRYGQFPRGLDEWLSAIIKTWKPDIIHTLGLFDDQGGMFYFQTRKKFQLKNIGKWILQLRGGSDIALRRFHPADSKILSEAMGNSDQIICDNSMNIKYANELGIPAQKFASLIPVPGSGGIDVRDLSQGATIPSQRERLILWPKAYECPWSKALPVLEAIQLAWKNIEPCRIILLAATPDVHEWYYILPEEIRKSCCVSERIPRKEVLSIMRRARVMLAPSLIDGIPNSLYEAMACCAFPIVSPLETIASFVQQDINVLFARNLYPEEIANALIRAMNDDSLVDRAAAKNLELVRSVADRPVIKKKVIEYYYHLLER